MFGAELAHNGDHARVAVLARMDEVDLQREAPTVEQMLARVAEVDLPERVGAAVQAQRLAGLGRDLDGVAVVAHLGALAAVDRGERVELRTDRAAQVDR